MNLNVLSTIIATAVSAITSFTLIYNLILKKNNSKEQKYYVKFLQPFIIKVCLQNKEKGLKFIKNNLDLTDDFIPKYIYYLIRENYTEENIIKVIVCDYVDLYDNDKKIIHNCFNLIRKTIVYILIFSSMFFLIVGSVEVTFNFVNLFTVMQIPLQLNAYSAIS